MIEYPKDKFGGIDLVMPTSDIGLGSSFLDPFSPSLIPIGALDFPLRMFLSQLRIKYKEDETSKARKAFDDRIKPLTFLDKDEIDKLWSEEALILANRFSKEDVELGIIPFHIERT